MRTATPVAVKRVIRAVCAVVIASSMLAFQQLAWAEQTDPDYNSCAGNDNYTCYTTAHPTGYQFMKCYTTEGGGSCASCRPRPGYICPVPYGGGTDYMGSWDG